ncbi:unnamed protein product [Rotaria sp. Silwood2]|nr:unnamed protein product [Rotaria sp. Silwood2]
MPASNLQCNNLSYIPLFRPSNQNINNYSCIFSTNGYSQAYPLGNSSFPSESTVSSSKLFFSKFRIHDMQINFFFTILLADPISTSSATAQIPPLMPVKVLPFQQRSYENPTLQKSTQHTPIDYFSAPTSQPLTAQNMKQSNSCKSTISSVSTQKRQRKPLIIIDPVSNKPIEIRRQSTNLSTTELSSSTSIENETYSTKPMINNSVISHIKLTIDNNDRSIQAELTNSSKTQTDKSVDSISLMNEDINSNLLEFQSASTLKTSASLECVTSLPSATINNDKCQPQALQQLKYDCDELLCIRDNSATFPLPKSLSHLPIVINKDDQSKIDDNNLTLRDVESILDEITPETFGTSARKLRRLKFDCYEKLEEIVELFYSKSVDEPGSGCLYARLCKLLSRKTAAVLNTRGRKKARNFHGVLIKHCQKQYANICREEIEYEKQKLESETVINENNDRDATKKFEEDFIKIKRRKLKHLLFGMIWSSLVFEYIEYLLRDKNDEESLEYLHHLLHTTGQKLEDAVIPIVPEKSRLEKYYGQLNSIVKEQKISDRICRMIKGLIELRQVSEL